MARKTGFLSGTDLIHTGKPNNELEVVPSISVTTTFRMQDRKDALIEEQDYRNPSTHSYSRYTQPISTRVEHILSKVNCGFALTYASGLAASYAALLFYQPSRIAITDGYHGCHATIELYRRSSRNDLQIIGLDDEYRAGDLCWLETPLNPTGEARDIKYYAKKVHASGGHLLVDSTFAPPPLQYPFKWGADCVLHSGSKYFGGHSDLLSGVLIVKTEDEWRKLHNDRIYLGSVLGSLESWLLLRSLKTLHLRISRQSETATALVSWLAAATSTPIGESYDGIPGGVLLRVFHPSLQSPDARGFTPREQMEGGWNATFSISLSQPIYAATLPYVLKYFTPATSLGGVESLIEQHVTIDPSSDPRIVRLSIGLEDLQDLRDDLRRGLREVVQASSKL